MGGTSSALQGMMGIGKLHSVMWLNYSQMISHNLNESLTSPPPHTHTSATCDIDTTEKGKVSYPHKMAISEQW